MNAKVPFSELPLPPSYDPARVGEVWAVPYQERAIQARHWAKQYAIQPAVQDKLRIALIGIDIQNTFCIPSFELFVAGLSGIGAVEDNRRLCEFLYRNLAKITHIIATLDTHTAMQIFHPVFLVDSSGEHPAPLTQVTYDDLLEGRWKFNPALAPSLGIEASYGQRHLLHYAQELKERQKYELTIWPYHVMMGSLGHALVSAFEEAVFFHTIARQHQAFFSVKGDNPLTEHYSAIGPEVLDGPDGESIARDSVQFRQTLQDYDIVVIAGQAKSHCVAWTIADLSEDIRKHNPALAQKVYLLEDCTSPVVVPGVVDFTEAAEAAFQRFADAGMHLVRSTDPIQNWPGVVSID